MIQSKFHKSSFRNLEKAVKRKSIFKTKKSSYHPHFGFTRMSFGLSNNYHSHCHRSANCKYFKTCFDVQKDIVLFGATSHQINGIHVRRYSMAIDNSSTIFALATSVIYPSSVAIIRISTPSIQDVHLFLKKMVRKSDKNLESILNRPRYGHLVNIYHCETDQKLDQSLLLYFEAPQSFTGEYVLELHVHGGKAIVKGVMDSLHRICSHFRLAEPGEFTKRALLNNKMDVTQVEALSDMLHSETEIQLSQAIHQYNGEFSSLISRWNGTMTEALAHLIAYIDFGDDDLDNRERDLAISSQYQNMKNLYQSIRNTLSDGKRGQKLREGIGMKISLIGAPNAGKSSLCNLLANEDVAIVSDVPGTTRDAIKVRLNLSGFPVQIVDTAGLHDQTHTKNEQSTHLAIEREGMLRAYQLALDSDLIILVRDSTGTNQNEDNENIRNLLDEIKKLGKPVAMVQNKIDLLEGDDEVLNMYEEHMENFRHFQISCKTRTGIEELLDHLSSEVRKYFSPQLAFNDPTPNSGYGASIQEKQHFWITRERHRIHLEKCLEEIGTFLKLIKEHDQDSPTIDLAVEHLRQASWHLGSIVGHTDLERILDIVFRDFCIGK